MDPAHQMKCRESPPPAFPPVFEVDRLYDAGACGALGLPVVSLFRVWHVSLHIGHGLVKHLCM